MSRPRRCGGVCFEFLSRSLDVKFLLQEMKAGFDTPEAAQARQALSWPLSREGPFEVFA